MPRLRECVLLEGLECLDGVLLRGLLNIQPPEVDGVETGAREERPELSQLARASGREQDHRRSGAPVSAERCPASRVAMPAVARSISRSSSARLKVPCSAVP